MVRNNMINDCPVTPDAITNTRAIFRPDQASMRGKTVQWTLEAVVIDYVEVLKSIIERNKIVTMAADVSSGDGIAFLLAALRQIKFIMVEYVATNTAKSLSNH
jgi:hypothetical protein